MKHARILGMGSALACVAAMGWAIPFDNSSGGPVTATVGPNPTDDYPSLAAAAAAFSAVTPSIEREWTLLITGDLTETTASYFGNTFGPNGKLIIKPAPATQPVVRFQIPTAPAGIYGDLVIGVTNGNLVNATNDRTSNGNYVIDGSNTPGGTTRDLTFMVPVGTNDPMLRVIRVWGDNHGVVIKNIKVYTYDSSGSSHCIGIAGGNVGGVSKSPNDLVIENCYLHAEPLGSTTGFGVDSSSTANGGMLPGDTMSVTIRGCTIEGKQRGIFLTHDDALIENNDILVTSGTGTTVTYAGIFPFNVLNGNIGTITIRNNRIRMPGTPSTSAAQGAIGIFIDTGTSVANVQIYNNIIKDMTFTSATPQDLLYRPISCAPNSAASTNFLVEHNSINADASPAVSGATGGRAAGISFPTAVTASGSAVIRNNIVVFREADGTAAGIYLASPTNVVSVGNNIVSPRAIGRIGVNDYLLLTDWQLAGYDTAATGGQSVDPALTTPAWDADLHFAYKPIGGLGNVAASTILTDFDGNARPASGAVPGADEPVLNAGVADWALF
ncbi:hypothetical protein BRCON_1420 [Candidatus Sumerlaea chitinivorans]|uniref:Right handed beta helix domain-containing protein n=1 Tax=Sumerlaea chitinivorans TaxID=2250252 RepID=A0A2Z4Y4S1_SUMC1|nr:hypothetical protein BRCON_1420 [Candidatus Sumerlaea chitinivorans]